MRTFSILFRILIVVLPICLQSCVKLVDRLLDPANGQQTKCAITNFIRTSGNQGTITYNTAGNPASVTYNEQGYDNNWHYFSYDFAQRLMEYRVELREGLDIEIHRYGYDEHNRIITDTGTFTLTGYIVIVSTFDYDSRNRIIKENFKIIDIEEGTEPFEIEPRFYNYDERGNLVNPLPSPDLVSYDQKISFRRTNKVWMFIERNYSLNNLTGVSSYNEYSLPVDFQTPVWFLDVSIVAINYECK